MKQDKNYVELNLNFKFKNGEGRNNAYSSADLWKVHGLLNYITDTPPLSMMCFKSKNDTTSVLNGEISFELLISLFHSSF